ncbi:MAG: 50S ribosomal protein L32 [Kiritimatiellae bacterium]|nr:50S ribosomal protein L32 [Kiritimatiellia bacterium]
MAQPKHKASKQRKRQRLGQVKAEIAAIGVCPNCGAPVQSHRACGSCGTYHGRQVMTVAAEATEAAE